MVSKSEGFCCTIPERYPDLVTSDQISIVLQNFSSQLSEASQDFLSYSITGIQNTITVAVNIVMLPILVFSYSLIGNLSLILFWLFFQRIVQCCQISGRDGWSIK